MKSALIYKSAKGKIQFNTQICVLCGTCQYVCPSGAINIKPSDNGLGYDFTVWHNTCTLCANCEYFCPTKSMKLTHDYNELNRQEDKYKNTSRGHVKYVECTGCGKLMVKVTDELLLRGFTYVNEQIKTLSYLCNECRQKKTFSKRVQYK